jgi:putative phage-type endonuclease
MLDREAWLKARQSGIGGSDISVVLGMNPWKSAYALWAEKTGKITPDDLSDNEAVEFGQLLEPVIANKYERVTGRRLDIWYPSKPLLELHRHPDHSWMLGTPDRVFTTVEGERGVLEIKTGGFFTGKDWEIEPPVHYQAQAQWYSAILNVSLISFAVLIGGQKFHWCDMTRNDRFIAFAIERGEEFWDCVQRDIPPPVDDSKSTSEALARLYAEPDEAAEPVMFDFEFIEMSERRRELKAQIRDAETAIMLIDNQIKSALGDAVFGCLPDGSGFSWKKQTRGSYVVPASSFRVLREITARPGESLKSK